MYIHVEKAQIIFYNKFSHFYTISSEVIFFFQFIEFLSILFHKRRSTLISQKSKSLHSLILTSFPLLRSIFNSLHRFGFRKLPINDSHSVI